MRRLDRYMLSQLLLLFGFFSLVLVAILWINRGVSLFEELISGGQSALVFLEFTALGLPKLIATVLPIATFGAAVYVTNRLINESELTVMQATGSGPFRLARPVLVFGLIAFAMSSMLHHALMPLSQQQLKHREAEIAQNATAQLLSEGRFLNPSDGVTFYAQRIDDDGLLHNVFLSDQRRVGEDAIYTAKQAYLIRDGSQTSLIMVDGLAQRLETENDRLSTTNFRDFSFDISSLVQRDASGRGDPDRLPTWVFAQPWDELSAVTGRSVGEVTYSFHNRIADPLFCIVAALIGFAVLFVGGYSRFGVWREVAIAFTMLVAIDGVRSVLQTPVRNTPEMWPLLYLPTAFSAVLVVLLLSIAARPQGYYLRFARRAA